MANPYIYCGNNPIMYVDPDGELFWLIPVIIGIAAGTANVVANWDHIDGFWQGFTTFMTGGLAGAGACFTGGWSMMGLMGYGALTGAVINVNSSIVAQTGHNFAGFNEVNWGQVGKSAGYGAASGVVGVGMGKWAVNANWLGVNGINSPMLRSGATAALASGATHVIIGTTAGLLEGQSFEQAFSSSFDHIGQSMVTSSILAGGTAAAISWDKGINPLTGKNIYPRNNGFKGKPWSEILQKGTIIDRYGSDTGNYFAPEGTPIEQRSLHPSTNTNNYFKFEVHTPFPVQAGPSAPFYKQPGMGMQYFYSGKEGTGKYLTPIKK